jgi:hypothetical protein
VEKRKEEVENKQKTDRVIRRKEERVENEEEGGKGGK